MITDCVSVGIVFVDLKMHLIARPKVSIMGSLSCRGLQPYQRPPKVHVSPFGLSSLNKWFFQRITIKSGCPDIRHSPHKSMNLRCWWYSGTSVL